MQLNVVPAKQGIVWVREGLLHVRRFPLLLLAGLMMYFLAMLLLSAVPIVGQLVALLLVPASNLGFMESSRRAAVSELPLPQSLVTAFRISPLVTQRMLMLGAVYLVAVIAVLASTALVDGGTLLSAMSGSAAADDATVQKITQSPAMLMFALLLMPVSILFWYAPALIAWDAQPVAKAVFMAFITALRNWKALILFALCWVAVLVISVEIISTIAFFFSQNALFSRAAVTPVVLLLMTAVLASFYPIYRDTLQQGSTSSSS